MTDQQHQRLVALAALHEKTIKQYAIERLPSDESADKAEKTTQKGVEDLIAEELAKDGHD